MVDPVDECAVQQLKEFDRMKLKPTTKRDLIWVMKKLEELKVESEPLTRWIMEVLGDKVVVDDGIVDSICVLTT